MARKQCFKDSYHIFFKHILILKRDFESNFWWSKERFQRHALNNISRIWQIPKTCTMRHIGQRHSWLTLNALTHGRALSHACLCMVCFQGSAMKVIFIIYYGLLCLWRNMIMSRQMSLEYYNYDKEIRRLIMGILCTH